MLYILKKKMQSKTQHRYILIKPTDEQQHIFNLYQQKLVGINNKLFIWQDTFNDEVFVCGRNPNDNRRYTWDERILEFLL